MSSTSVAELAYRAAELGGLQPCRRNTRQRFSDQPADLELAKASCRACPLREPCLAGAVERREPCGVWGGEILENGKIITHKRSRGRPGDSAA